METNRKHIITTIIAATALAVLLWPGNASAQDTAQCYLTQSHFDELAARIHTLRCLIDANEAEIARLKAKEGSKGRIDGLEARIKSLESQLSDAQAKYYPRGSIYLGLSFRGPLMNGVETNPTITQVNLGAEIHIWHLLWTRLELDVGGWYPGKGSAWPVAFGGKGCIGVGDDVGGGHILKGYACWSGNVLQHRYSGENSPYFQSDVQGEFAWRTPSIVELVTGPSIPTYSQLPELGGFWWLVNVRLHFWEWGK